MDDVSFEEPGELGLVRLGGLLELGVLQGQLQAGGGSTVVDRHAGVGGEAVLDPADVRPDGPLLVPELPRDHASRGSHIAAGAEDILEALSKELAKCKIEADILQVGCIGLCYAEPLIEVIKPGKPSVFYANLTPELVAEIVNDYLLLDNPRADLALGTRQEGSLKGIPRLFDLPVLKPQVRITLRNCGNIDPENIHYYIANDGYEGLRKALDMNPQEVIDEIKKSGLRGRGGAGFPTGSKWQFCHDAPGTSKYIICNADEGDPGAFMDRAVLEGDPHAVLEGMLIGAYAIGATNGYIYIRAEYPLAIKRLRVALQQMEECGLLGDNIIHSEVPATRQLMDCYARFGHSVVGVEAVPEERIPRYGIVGGKRIEDSVHEITTVVEKPSIEESPSNLAIAGRYILTPEIFGVLENLPKGTNNEVQLSDALAALLETQPVYSCTIEGKRYDIGDRLEYLKAQVEYGLTREELREAFAAFLEKITESR